MMKRALTTLLMLAIILSLLPHVGFVTETEAANLSSYVYQLPSRTLNDAGTNYRQNMSYVIQTRNKKFIVIDGGYEAGNYDAQYLINFLKEKSGKTVPHIDAWFITHPHEDHIGALIAVAKNFSDKVTVDTVYYNFPPDAQLDKYCPASSRATYRNLIHNFDEQVLKLKNVDGSTTKSVKLLAKRQNRCRGSFIFDVAQIDVLATCEDVFAAADSDTTQYSGKLETNGKVYSNQTIKQLLEADFGNNICSVFRLTVGGKNVLFMGDAAEPQGIVLMKHHNAGYYSLKSDIVQMAHHGQNGVERDVYAAMQPEMCLWNTPGWLWHNTIDPLYPGKGPWKTLEVRRWMEELGAQRHVITRDGTWEIALHDGAASVSRLEKRTEETD